MGVGGQHNELTSHVNPLTVNFIFWIFLLVFLSICTLMVRNKDSTGIFLKFQFLVQSPNGNHGTHHLLFMSFLKAFNVQSNIAFTALLSCILLTHCTLPLFAHSCVLDVVGSFGGSYVNRSMADWWFWEKFLPNLFWVRYCWRHSKIHSGNHPSVIQHGNYSICETIQCMGIH